MNTKTTQKNTIRKNNKNSNATYSTIQPLVKREVLGMGLTNATTQEVLEYLVNVIENSGKNIYVVTPNPEMVVLSRHDNGFTTILNTADLALCDGAGLFIAARFLGVPLKERIIGTNFVEKVCEKVADWPITVGFLGGGPGVAEQAAECLVGKYPGLKVAFVGHDEDKLLKLPKSLMPTVLFVAFGAPKQEKWMTEHINKIPVRVMIGVGGAFDQIVHPTLRPPKLIHSLGLGWFYRLIREPWRIKRQAKLVEFLRIVLKEKFS